VRGHLLEDTDSGMGQASKYDRVKLVNWISTLPLQYIYIEMLE
jgi:hypothetical protein